MFTKCCERDRNNDGNCDIHFAPGVVRSSTVQGKRVFAHYITVFNARQEIIGDGLRLNTPIAIDTQIVGDRVGVQIWIPMVEGINGMIGIHISNPQIIGIGLMDQNKKLLVGLSIPGHPELRQQDELFVLRSRYIILSPKDAPQ